MFRFLSLSGADRRFSFGTIVHEAGNLMWLSSDPAAGREKSDKTTSVSFEVVEAAQHFASVKIWRWLGQRHCFAARSGFQGLVAHGAAGPTTIGPCDPGWLPLDRGRGAACRAVPRVATAFGSVPDALAWHACSG